MNLIEQLGGYEQALDLFRGCPWDSGTVDVPNPRSKGMLRLDLSALSYELLEYRRQHNIFEVGDKVVIEAYRNTYISCGRPSQYSIGDLMVIRDLDGNVISDDDYNFIDYRDVRHATDAEIKAGKRLEIE